MNLKFVAQAVDLGVVEDKLATWLILHWVRVIVAIGAAFYAITAFTNTLNTK
ncbi:MAG: hypothetical protein AAFY48_02690 [Bacteroidota bacterium]